MSKHTPGPWQCFETEAGEARINPVRGGFLVAKCDTRNPFDEEQRANARLIAAAPELLEALRYYMAQFGQDLQVRGIQFDESQQEADKKARTAIFKATGETK
jgi:hypothetical protein